ncbi:YqeG family HAD IIIA-type phosphatase [Heyndrickxia acidiproducens]|uniref:YqeG family HAD IIIA-type phosphatase n=1 Tax=Heyndrickxia acidiproducens TaxID=1121084 RepID=UPI0003601C3A|nr:YqeG family HAD IIIA-type phosphatase [Heyndrickxia acidiproducens]
MLLKNFLPKKQVKSVLNIDPKVLKEHGIKAIITDLDNTLVEWDRPSAPPKLIQWFQNMKKHDIKVTIVSNNSETRVKTFADPLGIPFLYKARKPLGRAFRQALEMMNVKKEETVVIGDQLLTDVFGGNRSGFYTILVVPVAQSDGFVTKFNRKLERQMMGWFKKKGYLTWED